MTTKKENDIPFMKDILNASQSIDRKKCQMLYWNLIKLLDGREKVEPIHIIRELWHTERCDTIYNMKPVRDRTKEYINTLTPEAFDNMFTISKVRDDPTRDAADSAIIHYNSWYKDELINSLSSTNKAYYYLWYKAETALASWSIIAGGGIYGGKILFQRYGSRAGSVIKKISNSY